MAGIRRKVDFEIRKKGLLIFCADNGVVSEGVTQTGQEVTAVVAENFLGYAIILIIVGFFRELLGSGTLLGFQVIPQAFYDLGYVNNGLMILPPMALIVIAVIIWVHRAKNKELQEN